MSSIEERVTNLENAMSAQQAKMDTDFTGQNAAVTASELDTDYAATNPVSAAALNDVENVSDPAHMVRFVDGSGKQFQLKPGETKTARGVTAGMTQLVSDSKITVTPV